MITSPPARAPDLVATRAPARIVLTGGPGGGKTTAADLFRREIGECVALVPEAATMLFSGGFPRVSEPAALHDADHVFAARLTFGVAQHHRALDRVLELADIAGPGVAGDLRLRARAEAAERRVVLGDEAARGRRELSRSTSAAGTSSTTSSALRCCAIGARSGWSRHGHARPRVRRAHRATSSWPRRSADWPRSRSRSCARRSGSILGPTGPRMKNLQGLPIFPVGAATQPRTMDTHSLRNLTFLMSLGGLSLGCPAKEETTTDATTDPTTGATDPSTATMGGATDGASETDAGMNDTTSTEPTTSGTTEGTTGGVEPDSPLCKQLAERYVECDPEAASYFDYILMDCNMVWAEGEADGPACVAAFEEHLTCLLNLDCRQFNGEDEVCEAEDDAASAACPTAYGQGG